MSFSGASLLVFLTLVSSSLALAVSSQSICSAASPLTENLMTPAAIQGWVRMNSSKVKTVEDFVCCLPEAYRKKYVIGHSSMAAQNGIPKSPRVIMFAAQKTEGGAIPKKFMALSFNGGGHTSLLQTNSIEIAYKESQTGPLQYFDLEMNDKKGAHMSSKNPAACMSCHGQEGKVPAGGPRPIFDPFARWNRFVGGRGFCSAAEKKFFAKVERRAVAAIKKEPRYRCLDQSSLEEEPAGDISDKSLVYRDQFGHLAELDFHMAVFNAQRVPKLIAGYRDYGRLKRGLLGLKVCKGSLRDWLPHDVVEKMLDGRLLRASYLGDDWKQKASQEVDLLDAEIKKKETEMANAIANNDIPDDKPISPKKVSVIGCDPGSKNSAHEVKEDLGLIGKTSLSSEGLLGSRERSEQNQIDRFKVQSSLDGMTGDPGLRLLFESLGEDTGFWNMSPTGKNSLDALGVTLQSLLDENYKSDKDLRNDVTRFFDEKVVAKDAMFIGDGRIGMHNLVPKSGVNACLEYKKYVGGLNAINNAPSAAKSRVVK